jgi:hypothetical protein
MKSYVILEVFRIQIEQIIFSRFRNGMEKISQITFSFLLRKSIKVYPVGLILSGRSENKIGSKNTWDDFLEELLDDVEVTDDENDALNKKNVNVTVLGR